MYYGGWVLLYTHGKSQFGLTALQVFSVACVATILDKEELEKQNMSLKPGST